MIKLLAPSIVFLAAFSAISADPAAPEAAGIAAIEVWDDPEFQRQFLGSYGVQAELEPRLSSVERATFEKIMPMMATDPELAAAELEKIMLPESSALLDYTLGNIRFQQERLEDAARHFQHALSKFPSFRRASKQLGIIQVRSGAFDEAIRSLSRVVELGGGDGLTLGLLGYAYSSREQWVAAESAYRDAMLLQPEVIDWKLGLTQSVLKQRKYGETVSLCEELIERYPERSDYWLLQANAYIGLGRSLDAASNYEILQRMGRATPATLHTLGDIYVNEGLWDLALRAYGLAIEADPGQAVQRPLRNVEVLAQRGALPQARQLLAHAERAMGDRIGSDDRRRLLKLEARLAVAEGQSGEAVGVLEELVAIDPLDGEALILLGQHYARTTEVDRAIFYYERAASLEAFEADAKVRHAQVLVGQAKYREALPLLRRAQELKPREDVARFIEQVERLSRTL